jgi:hypothetical protein
MGAMINSYGHTAKVGWHEMKRELLKLKKREYEHGDISYNEYVTFLKQQIAEIMPV